MQAHTITRALLIQTLVNTGIQNLSILLSLNIHGILDV